MICNTKVYPARILTDLYICTLRENLFHFLDMFVYYFFGQGRLSV